MILNITLVVVALALALPLLRVHRLRRSWVLAAFAVTCITCILGLWLFDDSHSLALDHRVGFIGLGRLIDHLSLIGADAFMLVTVLLMSRPRLGWRDWAPFLPAIVLVLPFLGLWLAVRLADSGEMAAVYYRGPLVHPEWAIWLFFVAGIGFIYVAALNVVMFTIFGRATGDTERYIYYGYTLVYVISVLSGVLTLVNVLRLALRVQQSLGGTIYNVQVGITVGAFAIAASLFLALIFGRPLLVTARTRWQEHLVAPALRGLREDLADLVTVAGEMMNTTVRGQSPYGAEVDRLLAGRGFSPYRRRVAVYAANWLAYNLAGATAGASSWSDEDQRAAQGYLDAMRLTSWQSVLRKTYFLSDVSRVVVLLLRPDELPAVRRHGGKRWHGQVAATIASVLDAHGLARPVNAPQVLSAEAIV